MRMRADKHNPQQVYENYGDWLQTDYNFVWIVSLFIGYFYYLMTTEETQA
jgi:hypothetical protein